MRKILMMTSCAAAISALATTGALAQAANPQTGPTSAQTQSSRPMTTDASKSGSPAAQGSMQEKGTMGMSGGAHMSNGMTKKDKMMKKDSMGK